MLEIAKLGSAVKSWLDYWYAVSDTSNLLAESSIRFPITSYLERTKHITNVELECQHSIFTSRRIDIKWETSDGRCSLMEIKFVRKNSDSTEEMQRIFNDLLRLSLINDGETDKYFMLCGPFSTFEYVFKIRSIPKNSEISEKSKDTLGEYTTKLDMWLGFSDSCSNKKDVIETKDERYWKEFKKEYDCKIQNNLSFSTKQEFLQKQGFSIVGIWSIC